MALNRKILLAAALFCAHASAQIITTVAGTGTGGYNGDSPDQTAATATLYFPLGLAVDAAGNVYFADSNNHRVRRIAPNGSIATIAGDGTPGSAATNLAVPTGVAIDGAGNVYIADSFNHRIQKVAAGSGAVTTVAGTGTGGSGADGIATASQLAYPRGVAVDGAGNVYVADTGNHRIRKVTAGAITTIAGTGSPGCSATTLNEPRGIAVDTVGDVYIADSLNNRVMKLSGAAMSAFAGSATDCTAGLVEGAVAAARFDFVAAIALGDAGLMIADAGNDRIRRVSGGTVSTIAGTTAGFSGDGGAPLAAQLFEPRGVAAGPGGSSTYYIGDFFNNRIRKVGLSAPAAPVLDSAVAGNTQATLAFTLSHDGGAAATFEATCLPGPFTQSGAASPLVVTGLTNGTAYTCSVTATNSIGTSAASNERTVTPGTPPAITSAAPPPAGAVGVAYTHAYAASGVPASTFAVVTGGALPPGLTLSSAGVLSGTPTGAGTFTGEVAADNGVPPAGTQPFSITITKAAQAIGFDPLPNRAFGTGPFTLAALGGPSGNPVVFTSTTPGTCTTTGTNGTTLTLVGGGTCTVTASQAGNADYTAAAPVSRSFTITVVPTTLSLSAAAVDFGGQSMGTTSPAIQIVLTNTGAAPLLVPALVAPDPQFALSHNCAVVAAGATCTINASFSPAVSPGALGATAPIGTTLALASNAAGSPHAIWLAGTAEKSLVTHYYRSILRRAPDAGGKAFWGAESQRLAAIGANVNEAWFAMAASFYFSPEYAAFNRDTAGFVTDLYRTFFNRPPDQAGLDFWTGQIAAGMPREVVLVSFTFSAEFTGFTSAIFGNSTVRAERNVVMDFYRGLLARLPDDGGFNFWVGRFRTAQCQGGGAVAAEAEAISSQFAQGSEYAARARSSAQYVADLYNAFLRRGGDLAGVQYWIAQVSGGAQTREQVRQAFVASAEFAARVNAIVNAGCQT